MLAMMNCLLAVAVCCFCHIVTNVNCTGIFTGNSTHVVQGFVLNKQQYRFIFVHILFTIQPFVFT